MTLRTVSGAVIMTFAMWYLVHQNSTAGVRVSAVLAGLAVAWSVAVDVSPRFKEWSSRKGLPPYVAVMSVLALITALVWGATR